MSVINSLIPGRFLILTAHLVMVITNFWSRENNVKSCLPLDFTEEQYTTEDNRNQAVLSIVCHCSASVCLSFFVFQQWECWVYWIIFAFCSFIPALCELVQIIAVFGLKKKPM